MAIANLLSLLADGSHGGVELRVLGARLRRGVQSIMGLSMCV